MPAHGSLWRMVRPLEEGATAPWLRLYYSLLHDLSVGAHSTASIAKVDLLLIEFTTPPERSIYPSCTAATIAN